MKALCRYGTHDVRATTVPAPKIVDQRDAIIKVTAGGTVSMPGVYAGFGDKIPLGAT